MSLVPMASLEEGMESLSWVWRASYALGASSIVPISGDEGEP